jgi:hypothetical protein
LRSLSCIDIDLPDGAYLFAALSVKVLLQVAPKQLLVQWGIFTKAITL